MSQSTPLNQLPKTQSVQQVPQTDNDLVNDILNEMDSVPEATNDMNSDTLNYAMDSSQVPMERMDQNFLNNNMDTSTNMANNQESNNSTKKNKSIFGLNLNLGGSNNTKGGLFNKCVDKLKTTAVLFVLVVITSMPQFNRLVLTKIPKFLNESGAINMKGILFKSVLVSVLFLIVSFFL